MKANIVNISGNIVGEYELDQGIFGVEPNYYSISNLVRWQLNNSHTGTRSTKTRSMVSGTGKKNFRQKGTGSARRGSLTVSQFRHGGVVFGPLPVVSMSKMNKKERKLAMRSILSLKLAEKNLFVLDLPQDASFSTKVASNFIKALGMESALFVGEGEDFIPLRVSFRNIPCCNSLEVAGLNGVDLLSHKELVVVSSSINSLQERFAL